MQHIKWAIIGAGNIAKQFAQELKKQNHTSIVGITSLSQQSAQAFATQFEIKSVYQSAEQLVTESDAAQLKEAEITS